METKNNEYSKKLQELAKDNPDFKEAIKNKFPEAFEDEKYFDLTLVNSEARKLWAAGHEHLGMGIMEVSACSAPEHLRNHCFLLSSFVNWELMEYKGDKFLIPTLK